MNFNVNQGDYTSEDNILAHYRFEAGSGSVVNDISGNGYDINLFNSPSWVSL